MLSVVGARLALVALVVAFLLTACVAASDDAVVGCGGFVRPTAALTAAASGATRPPLDAFSVQLLPATDLSDNQHQQPLEVMSVAPNNGYYFLPVYTPGACVITPGRPPDDHRRRLCLVLIASDLSSS